MDPLDAAQEREAAHEKAERLMAMCQEWRLPLDAIDWQREGMLAWVAVSGVRIGCLMTLPIAKQLVLEDVRRALMADLACRRLGLERGEGHRVRITTWIPQENMSDLRVVQIDDHEQIPIAEYLRDDERIYEYYPPDRYPYR